MRKTSNWVAALALAASLSGLAACSSPQNAPEPKIVRLERQAADALVTERDIAALMGDMASGATTSEAITTAYLDRIARIDRAGPALNSIIALNPTALDDARALDAERAAGKLRGPLHGVPVLLKDNIETSDPMPTTAGSMALVNNVTGRDAPLVARLRAAGAVILGKTNLSEWANFRSDGSSSGWSAVGGLSRNPYALDRNTCGSSSGSGAATAASLAAASIGTETDGSIVCPSAINGLVGLKPTVGLVSRTFIVPISATQDTAGPMARSVRDAATILSLIAGTDPADPATAEADARKADYLAALDAEALRGKRIGVARFLAGYHPATDARFEAALETLKAAGAELVEIKAGPDRRAMGEAEFAILLTEFKVGLNAYLATTPAAVTTRSLADVIAFNKATPRELALFGQELMEQAEATKGLQDPAYLRAVATARRLAGKEGIDRMLAQNRVDAIVAPTTGPAWPTDLVAGDRFLGSSSSLAAVSGYPNITVPMGDVMGLPVGISFFGPAWSEARLLGFAFAFESRANGRKPPAFAQSVSSEAAAPLSR